MTRQKRIKRKRREAFDEMPESKFEALYQRTKQSIKDCAPAYQLLWEDSQV